MRVQDVVFHSHALGNLNNLGVKDTRFADVELEKLGSGLIADATDVTKSLCGQQGKCLSLAFQQSTVAGSVEGGR